MKILRNTVTAIFAIALLFLFSAATRAADLSVNPTGPIFTLSNLAWGVSGANGFNNNFWFAPLSQNGSVCVYVYNNDTTIAHTFSVSILGSANQSERTPSDATWSTIIAVQSEFAGIAPSPAIGVGGYSSAYALISVNLSASSVGGGSTPNANVVIIQTQGNCSISQNLSFGNPPQSTAYRPIQSTAESTFQSFFASASVTNPLANGDILSITNPNAAQRQIYFDRVTISSTASGQVNIVLVNTTGATCSSVTPTSSKLGSSGVTSIVTAFFTCTTNPVSAATIATLFLSANTTVTYDLTGIGTLQNTAGGVMVTTPSAITGTVSASTYWYEK